MLQPTSAAGTFASSCSWFLCAKRLALSNAIHLEAQLLAAERRERRDSRALTCSHQAVLGLRWFRDRRDIAALARDHGISRATGHRYLAHLVVQRDSGADGTGMGISRSAVDE
jgi:hypothetical protein